MLLPWCCKCCSRGSTGCPPPDLHLATTCCAQADSCPVACPSVCTWEAFCSSHAGCMALAHHAFSPLSNSLLGSLSFRRTNHLNKILKMLKFRNLKLNFGPRRAQRPRSALGRFLPGDPPGPKSLVSRLSPTPNSRVFTLRRHTSPKKKH